MDADVIVGASAVAEPEVDPLRATLRGLWAAVAPAWAEHASYADARGAHVAERMLAATAPRPGDRVLELACGPGGVGLAAAERVAPGEVVVSDVVPAMAELAASRAAAQGLANVRARVLDLERIDEPDGSYDVVLCREGLMFAPDPARAARELVRVLRPGGRLAVAVWGPRESNPWLTVVFDAVTAVTGMPVPPPGVPGPFSLSDRAALHGLFAAAGATGLDLSDVSVPTVAGSFDEWWRRTSALAGPLAKILDSLSDPARDAIRAHARAGVESFVTPAGLELPGVALLLSGRRG